MINGIIEAVSIPVIAKARIGHFAEVSTRPRRRIVWSCPAGDIAGSAQFFALHCGSEREVVVRVRSSGPPLPASVH